MNPRNSSNLSPAWALVGASLLLGACSPSTTTLVERDLQLQNLPSGKFTAGLRGPENLLVDTAVHAAYASDLSGSLSRFAMGTYPELRLEKQWKLGAMALGMAKGRDGGLYVVQADSGKDYWLEKGGRIVRLGSDLDSLRLVTGLFPGINGLTADPQGNLYFTTGNLQFLRPKGAVYRMSFDTATRAYGAPEILRDGLRSPNGIIFNPADGTLLITEVFDGVSRLSLDGKTLTKVVGKTRMVEGFDDLALDGSGRIWIADAAGGFFKRFDPRTNQVVRWKIAGLGVASSVRIVGEGADQSLLATERERKADNDGQGVLWIKISDLEKQGDGASK